MISKKQALRRPFTRSVLPPKLGPILRTMKQPQNLNALQPRP